MAKKKPTYSAPALDKALDVIELLSRSSTFQPLSAIAKSLGRTPSELFRIINRLEQRRYIVRDPALNAYALSLRFFEITNSIPPLRRLLDASAGPLLDLVTAIEGSCHLSVLEGGELVVVHQQEGTDSISVHIRPGSRYPATQTSSGPLLLARLDAAERGHALALDRYFAGLSARARSAMLRCIDELAGRAWWLNRSATVHPAVSDIVAPIRLYGSRHAALGAPVFQDHLEKIGAEKLCRLVARAAARIEKALGTR
jgi:DNA-binding IclR family transcriptional regulator